MEVLFIGQNPSRTNIDENVAFIGSRSHKTLQNWIQYLGVRNTDVIFMNATKKLGKVTVKDIDEIALYLNLLEHSGPIVCLGKYSMNAVKRVIKTWNLRKDVFTYFTLPHPSGLNRQNNNTKFITKQLELCKEFLKRCKYEY